MRVCCTMLILLPLALGATSTKPETALPRLPSSLSTNKPAASLPVPMAVRPATVLPTNKSTATVPSDSPPAAPAAAASDSSWAPQPFSRYEGILERKPFGQPSAASLAAAVAPAAPPPPPPPFASKLTLCAINQTPAGPLAVGFVDASSNPACSYYLNVHETQDGFTVVTADIDEESATVEKAGVSVDLKMGKGPVIGTAKLTPATPPPATEPPPALASAVPTTPASSPLKLGLRDSNFWPVPPTVKTIDNVLKMGITNESYLDKLRKRREEVLANQAAQTEIAVDETGEKNAEKAVATFLRRKNLESIRKGEGGLGIPLTPEEDAQLVNEGVLPGQK